MNILVDCIEGIGDNLYARPFVWELISRAQEAGDQVYIKTVLPFMYSGLASFQRHVHLVHPGEPKYRTQRKNFPTNYPFEQEPESYDRVIDFKYSGQSLKRNTIVGHMEGAFGFEPGSIKPWWMLPATQPHRVKIPDNKKLVVVRPVTLRKEWNCETRAPNPHYIGWCSKLLMNAGYHVVSIADCVEGEEWIEGPEPAAHQKFHHGELNMQQVLNLIGDANLVVGGSGFIIPAAVSSNAKLFVIFGGRGEYDAPGKVFDLRMDMSRIGWALPANFCKCTVMEHDCDKTITDLDDRFLSFMSRV